MSLINTKLKTVTVEALQACDPLGAGTQTDATAALKRKLEKLNLTHVRALFAGKKLAFSTSMIMAVWGLIGMDGSTFGIWTCSLPTANQQFLGLGFPLYNAFLPYIQATRGEKFHDGSTYITYRNSLIIAVLGVPGALLGGVLVEIPRFGRKGALAFSTILTGVFLYATTTAKTSNALLGWNCAYNFFANIMYAVLYAYTPEIFPTKDRGTGNALTASTNRIFGIMAVSSLHLHLALSIQVLTSIKANHRDVCQPGDFSSCVHQWSIVHSCRTASHFSALRATRESESMIPPLLFSDDDISLSKYTFYIYPNICI